VKDREGEKQGNSKLEGQYKGNQKLKAPLKPSRISSELLCTYVISHRAFAQKKKLKRRLAIVPVKTPPPSRHGSLGFLSRR